MAGFNYRFENILRLKTQIEDQKKIEFGEMQKLIARERDRLVKFKKELDEVFEVIRAEMTGSFHREKITCLYNRTAEVIHPIEKQEQLLKNLHNQEHEKRKELMEAMIQKNLYERMRENKLQEWKSERDKKEQKFLDFLNIVPGRMEMS